jgi:hypothetical protein
MGYQLKKTFSQAIVSSASGLVNRLLAPLDLTRMILISGAMQTQRKLSIQIQAGAKQLVSLLAPAWYTANPSLRGR